MKLPSHIHGIKRIVRKMKYRPEIMKDFISFKEFSIDHGESESLKSWLQRDVFLHISEGLTFLDRYETVQTPCVIFNQDEDSQFVDAGMKALIRGEYEYGILETENPPNIFLVHGQYNLSASSEDDASQMIEDIETISEYCGSKVRLIGLDAQSDFMPDHDVSASAPSKVFFKRLKTIRESTGVAIHIIHHDNRKGEFLGYIGSRNSSDRFTELSRTSDIVSRSYTTKHGKRRHGTKDGFPMRMEFVFETVDGKPNSELKFVYAKPVPDSLIVANLGLKLSKKAVKILYYIQDHGPSFKEPVEEYLGSVAPNAWSKLRKEELLRYTDETLHSLPKEFELTDIGTAHLKARRDV